MRLFLILLLLLDATAVPAQQQPAKPRAKASRQPQSPDDGMVVAVPLSTEVVVVDTFQGRPVYNYAPQMPTYPGGNKALWGFLNEQVRYPPQYRKDQVEGKVFVEFTIDRAGRVQRAFVRQGLRNAPACDVEALRVVRLLGRFTPGYRAGRPVAVRYVVPVDFRWPGPMPDHHQ